MRQVVLLFCLMSLGLTPTPKSDVDQNLDRLAEILVTLQNNALNPPTEKELADGAMKGLLWQLDPHSNYFNANRFAVMRENQKSSFHGIGIHLGHQDNRLLIVAPIPDTPAHKAGLKAGDIILAIDDVSTLNMDSEEAIRLLRGPLGGEVELTIGRSELAPFKVTLARDMIPSENVRTHILLEDGTGYIRLRDFGEEAESELIAAILKLEGQGMTQTILDLRGNPGGLLPQAIGISGLFLPGKKIVFTKGRINSSNQEYFAKETTPIKELPLVVLIDRGSASASEIVAGAIQDYDRGLIVGLTSWGKGLVQSVYPLGDGSHAAALTTARYYTPSGRNIQGEYESWEDYYTPQDSRELYFDPDRQNLDADQFFTTKHGRTVLQVRGIVPDVYLEPFETPTPLKSLYGGSNYIYDFAVAFQDQYLIDPEIKEAELLASFSSFCEQNELGLKYSDLAPYKDYLIPQITYQLMFTHDSSAAQAYQVGHDQQVAASLELMTKAKELLEVYQGARDLRPELSDELKQFARARNPLTAQSY